MFSFSTWRSRRRRFWDLSIKSGVLLLLAWTLYRQVFSRDDLEAIYGSFLGQLRTARWGWLLLTLALMPFNWGLEAIKWRRLLREFMAISFVQALSGVLSGVTVSLFTPNRIGEYGGRILQVEARHNWKAVVATLVGSLSQQMVLLAGGLAGLAFFASNYLNVHPLFYWSLLGMGSGLVLILLLCFFHLPLLLPLLRRVVPSRRIWRQLLVLRQFSRPALVRVLSLAALRYATYTLQYYLVLRFFGIEPPAGSAMAGIVTIFLVQTSVPLPPLLGLLARGEIALMVWSVFTANQVSILAATFTLFIINLCLPALLGAGVIVKTNILKSLGYEKNDD